MAVETNRIDFECAHCPSVGEAEIFDQHKGYCTPEHLERLARLGPCAIHPSSFEPVRVFFQKDMFSES